MTEAGNHDITDCFRAFVAALQMHKHGHVSRNTGGASLDEQSTAAVGVTRPTRKASILVEPSPQIDCDSAWPLALRNCRARQSESASRELLYAAQDWELIMITS